MSAATPPLLRHAHVFLGTAHGRNEHRTWMVIGLCAAMMAAEIAGGWLFGSIALVADGMHMSTHAGALLLAALAYRYAHRHAEDPRFTFGTGKLGDLAGFTSAVVLALIALLIGYEAVGRFLHPVPIHFAEAIPIAGLGLAVNILSAWLLMGADHGHGQRGDRDHGHGHDQLGHHQLGHGRLGHGQLGHGQPGHDHAGGAPTSPRHGSARPDHRPNHTGQNQFAHHDGPLKADHDDSKHPGGPPEADHNGSKHPGPLKADHDDGNHPEVPPGVGHDRKHAAALAAHHGGHRHSGDAGDAGRSAHRDNNIRAAFVHVLADAAVSVLVIAGLLLARGFGWLWMDPLAGLVGAGVIASWSRGLIRDTGAILLDMNPDPGLADRLRHTIESDGDTLADLHLWRLGPGHLGAIVAIGTRQPRGPDYYRARLARFRALSHLTIEVDRI